MRHRSALPAQNATVARQWRARHEQSPANKRLLRARVHGLAVDDAPRMRPPPWQCVVVGAGGRPARLREPGGAHPSYPPPCRTPLDVSFLAGWSLPGKGSLRLPTPARSGRPVLYVTPELTFP